MLAVTILFIHAMLAVVHTAVLVYFRRSIVYSWDSINELLILAYNSTTRPNAFANSSCSIVLSKTLEKEIRIDTRVHDNREVCAELIVCGEGDTASYVEAGKKYS